MSLSPQFDGFSEPSQNYYRLPNNWFFIVALLREKFGERLASLLKMLEYILRHTWGYRNFDRPVRLTAREIHSGRESGGKTIDHGTGLAENSVTRAGKILQEMGLIIIEYDESDAARRVRTFRPHIHEEPEEADEEAEAFNGFDSPTENYFKVPAAWTNLTRNVTSAACILVTEYLFRHAWGFQNPKGIWMDADEVANGRKYITEKRRYDGGIGFDLSTTYRALNEAVERGFLVWAERWENYMIHRVYNLRLKGMPVDAEGRYLGVLPWEEDLPEELRDLPTKSVNRKRRADRHATAEAVEGGIGTVEDGIDTVEVGSGANDASDSGIVEETVCTVEDGIGTVEDGIGTDEARTEAAYTLTDTSNQTPSSDTRPARDEKSAASAIDGDGDSIQEIPENTVQDGLPGNVAGTAIGVPGKVAGTGAGVVGNVAGMLPESILADLQTLGWEGDTREVARAYAADPDRVSAWLRLILSKRKSLDNPAGLFRTRVRDGSAPPGYRKPAEVVDPTTALEARRAQARQRVEEARRKSGGKPAPLRPPNPIPYSQEELSP